MSEYIRLLKYVEDSFEGKPSFLIEMSDGIFISNGCVFIRNTEEKLKYLVREWDCEDYLVELMDSPVDGLTSISNASGMFYGSEITSFSANMSSVRIARGMFKESMIGNFDIDMPSLVDASCMFERSALFSFRSNMPLLRKADYMFYNTKVFVEKYRLADMEEE